MTFKTAAQAAQQQRRDTHGRYSEKLAADPGPAMLTSAARFEAPPVPLPAGFPDTDIYLHGADIDAIIEHADVEPLTVSIQERLQHLTAAQQQQLARDLVACRVVAHWMDTGRGDAAIEAEWWDDTHPGERPYLYVLIDNYRCDEPDGEHGYEWDQIAEDNSAACNLQAATFWRQAELEDRRRGEHLSGRRPAA